MNLEFSELRNIIDHFKELDSYESKKDYYESFKKSVKVREFWEEIFYYYEEGEITREDLESVRDDEVKNELSIRIEHYISLLANNLRFQVLKKIDKRPQSAYDLHNLIDTSNLGHLQVGRVCEWLTTIGLCVKEKYGFRNDNRGWKYSILKDQKEKINLITNYTDNFIANHSINFPQINYLIDEQYLKKVSVEVTRLSTLLDIYSRENHTCFVHEMMPIQKRHGVRIDGIINELEEEGYLAVDYVHNSNTEKPYQMEDIKNNYLTFFNRKLEQCSKLTTLEDVEEMSNSILTYVRNKYYYRDVLKKEKKRATLTRQGNLCGEFLSGIYYELKKEIPELKYYV